MQRKQACTAAIGGRPETSPRRRPSARQLALAAGAALATGAPGASFAEPPVESVAPAGLARQVAIGGLPPPGHRTGPVTFAAFGIAGYAEQAAAPDAGANVLRIGFDRLFAEVGGSAWPGLAGLRAYAEMAGIEIDADTGAVIGAVVKNASFGARPASPLAAAGDAAANGNAFASAGQVLLRSVTGTGGGNHAGPEARLTGDRAGRPAPEFGKGDFRIVLRDIRIRDLPAARPNYRLGQSASAAVPVSADGAASIIGIDGRVQTTALLVVRLAGRPQLQVSVSLDVIGSQGGGRLEGEISVSGIEGGAGADAPARRFAGYASDRLIADSLAGILAEAGIRERFVAEFAALLAEFSQEGVAVSKKFSWDISASMPRSKDAFALDAQGQASPPADRRRPADSAF